MPETTGYSNKKNTTYTTQLGNSDARHCRFWESPY